MGIIYSNLIPTLMIKHGKISDILNTTLSVHLCSPDSGNGKNTKVVLLLLKNNHMGR